MHINRAAMFHHRPILFILEITSSVVTLITAVKHEPLPTSALELFYNTSYHMHVCSASTSVTM